MLQLENNEIIELTALCAEIRELTQKRDFDECRKLICAAMCKYPDAPQPHNLLGIVLEYQNRHTDAMKHFRAARCLDAAYLPATHNLEHYGTFYPKKSCAFDENDC